jgi:uncharacterized membrane protein YsdA (DUF1294 family)
MTFVGMMYGLASAVCFLAYAWDKRAAQRGLRRWPERHLLLLGCVGGWPGGLLAQRVFLHKTRKPAFQRAFWTTVALNVTLLVAWLGWCMPPAIS